MAEHIEASEYLGGRVYVSWRDGQVVNVTLRLPCRVFLHFRHRSQEAYFSERNGHVRYRRITPSWRVRVGRREA